MDKKQIFLALFAFLAIAILVTGCGPRYETADTVDIERKASEEIIKSGEQAVQTVQQISLTQEQKDSALNLVSSSNKFAVFPPSLGAKTLKPGESYIFAVALFNMNKDEKNYKLRVNFKEARTELSAISVDKDYMAKWVERNAYVQKSVGGYEKMVEPLLIEVKDIKAGMPVKKGTYIFTVEVIEVTAKGFENFYSSKDIFINVE